MSLRRPNRLVVVSGFYPGRRFASIVNHQAYCARFGYTYVDASSPGRIAKGYFRKIEMLQLHLNRGDWLFWLDDDAYFTDFASPLEAFIASADDEGMVVCKSPSTKSLFTKFSAGQFFLKNRLSSHRFLEAAMHVDLQHVRRAFWETRHGFFTNGDQDAFVYLSETHPEFSRGFVRILDHNAFNNRDFEYAASPSEHFLVHFTGREKVASKAQFCARLHVNRFLTPDDLLPPPEVLATVEGA